MENLVLKVNFKDLKLMSTKQLKKLRSELIGWEILVSRELERHSKEDNLLVN